MRISRYAADAAFSLLLLVVAIGAIAGVATLNEVARLFPTIIAVVLACLTGIHFVRSLRSRGESELALFTMANEASAAFMAITAWLFGIAVLAWLLGFPFAGTASTLAYLRFASREPWRITLIMTLGTAAFFVLTGAVLHVPYPKGLLLALLGT